MMPVTCPSCGEKGNIPDQAIGKKVRCQKCSRSFLAGGPTAGPSGPAAADEPARPGEEAIEVDGLDASTWAATAVVSPVGEQPPQEKIPPLTDSPRRVGPAGGPARQYKVLTQKDRWFEGKFELSRLEEALNYYAGQGWVVRGIATPLVTGFSGGPREEIIVLLER